MPIAVRLSFVVLEALLLVTARPAWAQQPAPENGGRRTIVATRLADGESIAMDGQLDEPVWARAVPATDFVQIDPANGRPPTEPTEVRIASDRDNLYIGVTCFPAGHQRRKPAVGRHLGPAHQPERHRVDNRGRDPVPHAQLQSESDTWGINFQRTVRPQERGEHLDGMGAQPRAAPHDQHAAARRAVKARAA
jgi:hypothetical protein